MKRQIAGQLFWRDDIYLLLDPHPLIEREHWMKDTDERFLVCVEGGINMKEFVIMVSRPFCISYRRMGEEITIQEKEETLKIQETEPHWLNELLKGEPATLAE